VGTGLLSAGTGSWVALGRDPGVGDLGGSRWREGVAAGLEPGAGSVPGLPARLLLSREQERARDPPPAASSPSSHPAAPRS